MKQSILKIALGAMLVATALSASAASVTAWVTAGPLSPYFGVTNTNFGGAGTDNANPIEAPMTTFTNGLATYSGGNLYNTTTTGISGISARPVGSVGNWWSIQSGQTGTVNFSTGIAYYGFLWGSPDVTPWNKVSFYDSSNVLLASFGQQDFNPSPFPNNSWLTTGYLNVMTTGTALISKITFKASANAFETDNHAYSVSPVPLPAAAWLFGSALMGLGALRRKQKAGDKSEMAVT
jgi:hypothetical protein